jgi:hypothetical protein
MAVEIEHLVGGRLKGPTTNARDASKVHPAPIVQQYQMRRQPACRVWARKIDHAEQQKGAICDLHAKLGVGVAQLGKVDLLADGLAQAIDLSLIIGRRPDSATMGL